jgi:hypothetical protein
MAPVLCEELIVVHADLLREIEVGMEAPGRKSVRDCQSLEKAELDRRTVCIHEWHTDENDWPGRALLRERLA